MTSRGRMSSMVRRISSSTVVHWLFLCHSTDVSYIAQDTVSVKVLYRLNVLLLLVRHDKNIYLNNMSVLYPTVRVITSIWYITLMCVYVSACVSFSELIQTELHHMRTLYIMERVFRQNMLDELQLDPSTVHVMFPCLDHLIRIHSHFLAQLLQRRNNSLQPGSCRNFTIHQLGDILLEQVWEAGTSCY